MNLETLYNGAKRCVEDPGEPGYPGILSRRISVTPQEEKLLTALCYRENVVLEIGTGLGVSTRAIARGARSVITVDIDAWVHENIWPTLPINVLTQSAVPYKHVVDVVFIDGLHLPEAVRRDIQDALVVLRPDGFFLFHDILIDKVREPIEATLGEAPVALSENLGWLPNPRGQQ